MTKMILRIGRYHRESPVSTLDRPARPGGGRAVAVASGRAFQSVGPGTAGQAIRCDPGGAVGSLELRGGGSQAVDLCPQRVFGLVLLRVCLRHFRPRSNRLSPTTGRWRSSYIPRPRSRPGETLKWITGQNITSVDEVSGSDTGENALAGMAPIGKVVTLANRFPVAELFSERHDHRELSSNSVPAQALGSVRRRLSVV